MRRGWSGDRLSERLSERLLTVHWPSVDRPLSGPLPFGPLGPSNPHRSRRGDSTASKGAEASSKRRVHESNVSVPAASGRSPEPRCRACHRRSRANRWPLARSSSRAVERRSSRAAEQSSSRADGRAESGAGFGEGGCYCLAARQPPNMPEVRAFERPASTGERRLLHAVVRLCVTDRRRPQLDQEASRKPGGSVTPNPMPRFRGGPRRGPSAATAASGALRTGSMCPPASDALLIAPRVPRPSTPACSSHSCPCPHPETGCSCLACPPCPCPRAAASCATACSTR